MREAGPPPGTSPLGYVGSLSGCDLKISLCQFLSITLILTKDGFVCVKKKESGSSWIIRLKGGIM
jgi:hypothetical protein